MNSQVAVTETRTAHKDLLALLFAGFVVTGVATVLIGPILPTFIRRFSLDDSQAGLFFTVQFTAALAGVLGSSALVSRGFKLPLVLGYLVMAGGFAMVNAPTRAAAFAAIAALGLGYGLVVPGTNLSVAEAGGAPLLNLANFAWGAGAVACSPLLRLSFKFHFFSGLLIGLALSGCALAFALLVAHFPEPAPRLATDSQSAAGRDTDFALTVALGTLFFTYVGVETSLGGWIAEHVKRLAHGPSNFSTIAPMFFYSGIMIGRANAPFLLARIREGRLVLGALTLVAIGTAIAIVATGHTLAIFGISVAGLGCATVYPNYIAWFSRWYGPKSRRLSGIMFSLASVGGAVVPWVVGFVSKHAGSLRAGLAIPLAGTIGMICIVLALGRRTAT